jgi:retinol dehydrogenase-12
LASVQRAAAEFTHKETRLDALWNNAGIMLPRKGVKTEQGLDMQLGTNAVAPWLFTRLLTGVMAQTAKAHGAGSVRVIWVSSSSAELSAPKVEKFAKDLEYRKEVYDGTKYGISKAVMAILGQEYAKRHKDDGIISVVGCIS